MRTLMKMVRPNPNRAFREMLEILKRENGQLEHQVRTAESAARGKELAENALEGAMLAVRILAKGVTSKTAAGKRLRAEARKALEECGLRPPGTLGNSREKKRRRPRKKGEPEQRLDPPGSTCEG